MPAEMHLVGGDSDYDNFTTEHHGGHCMLGRLHTGPCNPPPGRLAFVMCMFAFFAIGAFFWAGVAFIIAEIVSLA